MQHNFKMVLTLPFLLTLLALIMVVSPSTIVQLPDAPFRQEFNVYRQMIVNQNVDLINRHNAKKDKTYTMKAYPQFVGLTREEFKARFVKNYQGFSSINLKVELPPLSEFTLKNPVVKGASGVDWSSICSTIYNQGQCGNCYAFASVETVDCYYAIRNVSVPKLSIQQLTDCSSNPALGNYNNGCLGGSPSVAMWYIAVYGLVSMAAYPLNPATIINGTTEPCRDVSSTTYYIQNWYTVETTNCSSQIMLLSYGFPLTTAMDANDPALIYYQGGIISGCSPVTVGDLDHAIMMVGYKKNGANSYIKIKNSWGTAWGEGGFFRISMFNNQLGICFYSVSPYA